MQRKRLDYSHSSGPVLLRGHPNEPLDLFVICYGIDKCQPDYRYSRTNHPVYVMEYVMRGEGTFQAGGRSWHLHGGMCFFYGPGTPHTYWTDPVNTMVKLWVVYAGRKATSLTREVLGQTYGAFALANPETIHSVMEAIATDILNKSLFSQQICDNFLRALLPRSRPTSW